MHTTETGVQRDADLAPPHSNTRRSGSFAKNEFSQLYELHRRKHLCPRESGRGGKDEAGGGVGKEREGRGQGRRGGGETGVRY